MRPALSLLLAGVAASALLSGGPAGAQEARNTQTDTQTGTQIDTRADTQAGAPAEMLLDTVSVTVGAERAASGPAGTVTTSTTTRREIDNRLVDDIQDLGRTEEAGVSFNRATGAINIRGLEGSRVLTVVDGVRVPYLADATRAASGGSASFDFNALSSLDLTRGADPLLGSGALGGVLAVRTLDPEDLLLGGRRIGAITKNGYDSTDRSWFTSNAAAARVGDTLALVQGGWRTGHELDTQGGLDTFGPTRTAPNPLDFDTYNLLGKLVQYAEGGHRFGLVGEVYAREDDIDGRTSQSWNGNYRPGQYRTGEELERRKAALTYDFEAPGTEGWIDEASAVLYWQDVSRETSVDAYRSTSVIGPFERRNSLDEEAFGFNGFLSNRFETGAVSHKVTLGTELRRSVQTQYSAGRDNCSLRRRADIFSCGLLHTNQADTPEVEGALIGLYAENEVGLLDGRLRVTPGLRFDWYEEEPQMTPQYRASAAFPGRLPPASGDEAFSPKLLAEYDLTPALTVYGQYAAGFRAPTAGELFSRFGAVGSYLRVGNPDLDPETSQGFDAGLRYGDETLGGRLNLFTTRYRNFIDTEVLQAAGGEYPLGGITGYRNIPDARISGVELAGHVRFLDFWRARASLAYAQGQNLTDDTWLDSVPPFTAILGLGYERAHWGAEISTKLAARRDKVDDGFVAPGYGVVDLTAYVEPEQLPGLKIAGGLFNVFDKTYYDAVTVPETRSQPNLFYSEPGRAFKLNVTYRF